MADPRRDPHAWFRERLEDAVLGLLEEPDEQRFVEHATACPECGATLRDFRDHLPAQRPDAHIPARLLARWDRGRRRLRGLARTLVRRHLETCAACRQDLEALGHAPVLEVDRALEEPAAGGIADPDPRDPSRGAAPEIHPVPMRGAEPWLASTGPAAASGPPIVIVRRAPARRRAWLEGGAVGAGLAAAILLVVAPPGSRAPDPGATPPAADPPVVTPVPGAPPASPAGSGLRLDVLGRARAIPAPTRSPEAAPAGAGEPTLALAAGARFVHLALPDFYLPDSARLSVEVIGPDGGRAAVETTQGALGPGRTLLLGDPSRPLPPGLYRLLVRPRDEPGGTPPIELRVRLAAPRR